MPGLSLGEEVARLLAVPDVADPLGLRDRRCWRCFTRRACAGRSCAGWNCPDVNPERGTLTVRQGKGRRIASCRWGRAPGRGSRAISPRCGRGCAWTRASSAFLTGYGEAFNPDVLSRMVSAWMKAAALARKGSCHLLRHTCATHMLEGGADIRYIQQLLGHEKLETTAIYTEVTIRQLIEVHARCHPSGKLETRPDGAPSA